MIRFRRLAIALLASGAVLATSATAVLADFATPTFVDVRVAGLTVTITGTYEWQSRINCDATNRYAGWAIAWNDPADQGNPIGDTGVRVGTAADNTVHTNGDCGAVGNGILQGTFGPISHTYRSPGMYRVCVVLYDIHAGEEQAPRKHNLIATGPDRNRDNSIDNNGGEIIPTCPSVQITVAAEADGASPAPSGSAGPAASGGLGAVPGGGAGGASAAPGTGSPTDAAAPVVPDGRAIALILTPIVGLLVAGLVFVLLGHRRRGRPQAGPMSGAGTTPTGS